MFDLRCFFCSFVYLHLNRTNNLTVLSSLVTEPPAFIKPLTPVEVVNGASTSFECQVTGSAPFEITWHKDSKEIKLSSKHVMSKKNESLYLEIQKCDALDVGEYQCTVANEVGSCSCQAELSIKGL